MGDTFVISGLRQKRARIAGEIAHAREIIAHRTEELAVIDTVLRLFAQDCDPDMIPPIKPASHGLFFRYRELGRICVDVLREAGAPVMLDRIVAVAIETKGLPDDKRLRKHVIDTTRATLGRMERKGLVRRVVREPNRDVGAHSADLGPRLGGTELLRAYPGSV